MYDDQTLGRVRDELAGDAGRDRGARVRLAWMSRETLAFLLVSMIVVAILSTRLDVEEPPGRSATAGAHDVLLEAMALDASGDVLISSGWDDAVRFWDLDPSKSTWGEEVLTLPHDSRPYALAPSRDGRYLAVGGAKHLTLWQDGEDGWEPLAVREGMNHRYLAFAPDSRTLAVGGEGSEIRVLEAPTLEVKRTLKGLTDMVHCVAFSPDGTRVAASSFRGELVVWDWRTGEQVPLGRKVGRIHCFAFSSDGRTLATGGWWDGGGGGVALWDVATGASKGRLASSESFNALAFAPGDRVLAGAGVQQVIKLWDVGTGEVRGVLDDKIGWVKAILFTPGGDRLAYGGRDGAIRFWDVPAAAQDARVGAADRRAVSKAG